MSVNPGPGRVYRRVRVQLEHGAIEGGISIGEQVRTLDDLNMASARFVTLVEPQGDDAVMPLNETPVVLSKSRILFLVETGEPPARLGRSAIAQRMNRSPIRMRVGEYLIEGFVHVPFGGKPMLRLKQEGHPFLAVTEAKVVGSYATLEAGFLAVNREHVVAGQDLPDIAAAEPEPAETDRPAETT